MRSLLKLSLFAFLIILSSNAIGQNTISIQSTLKNISGEAVADGPQSITFKLYTVLEGGSAVWEETADVEVVSGIYSHELGSMTPLNPSDFGVQLYLGVTINNRELAPRTKLGFAPYAMAVTALAAQGQSASFDSIGQFVISDAMEVIGQTNTNGVSNTGTVESDVMDADSINVTNMVASKIGLDIAGIPTGDINLGLGGTSTGISGETDKILFYVDNDTVPDMMLRAPGYLTIGNGSPSTATAIPLTVGPVNQNAALVWGRFFTGNSDHLQTVGSSGSNGIPLPDTWNDFVARFEGSVFARNFFSGFFVVSSDSRIKTNITASNPSKDLDLLNQIEVVEYNLIDQVNNASRTQKKVVAQQVEEVLPNAISLSRKVIPNVYEKASQTIFKNGILQITTNKAHEFVTGDRIDLKTPSNELNDIEVLEVIDAHTFSVKADKAPEKVFVYGKYVDDFRSVDYDAIAMLNVSATQELYRMIKDLQKANKTLVEENNTLRTQADKFEERLATIEALMVSSKSNHQQTHRTEER